MVSFCVCLSSKGRCWAWVLGAEGLGECVYVMEEDLGLLNWGGSKF